MRTEGVHGYEFHLTDLDCEPARDVLMGTRPELTVPNAYRAYAWVLEEGFESMPCHSPKDVAIELLDGKQLPWGPVYNLSKKEWATFQDYLKMLLKKLDEAVKVSSRGLGLFRAKNEWYLATLP
jgi:hypothetical protein